MSVRRSLFILTVLTLVIPVAVFGYRNHRPQQPTANIQEYSVQIGDVDVAVSAVGSVDADRTAALSFSARGRIADVMVSEGDTVQAGDVLARLDDDAQQIALQQAALGVQLAILQKDQLLAGPDEAQIAVAEANVNSAMGAVRSIQNAVPPEQIEAAQLAYEQAQAAVTAAQHDRAFNAATEAEGTLLDAKVGEATFNAEIARLNLASLQNGSSAQLNAAYARVAQAQAELDRIKAGTSDADISRADAAIAQAQVALDRAQAAADRALLTAPFDGIITAVNAEIGALAAPGMAIVEIADVEPLRLTVQIDEIDVRRIRVGMDATIQLDALPDASLSATVEQIALVPTNNGGIVSYDATVRLSGSDPRVRVGMTADASVVVDSRRGVLVVPNQYIRLDRARGGAFVNVVQPDGRLREVQITLGLQGQDRSELTDGLKAGDRIGIDLSADAIGIFGGG
jgi:HlyD family secretion protein